ncbi:MAG: hypothetical protein CVV06_19155 [Gammaproteobacteria bacterium HGW-Gammaproteobacteria-10]|nr:MAG: hypothetical protein CVV06_19155 [Gammaproteobacteria bacterium HGW-Gammaproteobacteria-10]
MTPEYWIDAEQRIASYLAGNDVEDIKYMQVEQTFDDLRGEVHVWYLLHSLPNAATKPHLLSVPGVFLYRYGRI